MKEQMLSIRLDHLKRKNSVSMPLSQMNSGKNLNVKGG